MTMPKSGPRRELRAEAVLGRIEARASTSRSRRHGRRDVRDFPVTLRIVREYTATIRVPARDQAEADRRRWRPTTRGAAPARRSRSTSAFPSRGTSMKMCEHDPEIDRKFRCVDCDKSVLGGEYYMVADELWAASGMEPNGGMLCLVDLDAASAG